MVSRRLVLQAGVASLFAPTVVLRQNVSRERFLRPFCDSDFIRYDLAEPFKVGSLTYATDGRSIVRCELLSTLDDGVEKRRPNVELVYNQLFKPRSEFIPLELPSIESLEMNDWGCPVCLNRRLPSGDFRDEYHQTKYDYDPDDETIADISCRWCHSANGEPLNAFRSVVSFNGGTHRFVYSSLLKIAAIPNVRVALSIPEHDAKMPLLLFRGDGFEGMAASLRV
jgi:hypothetical protein